MEKTNNFEVRIMDDYDLNKNAETVIKLLEHNYIINFPHRHNFSEYVNTNFRDMVKYIKNGSALIIGVYLHEKIIGFLWAYKRNVLGQDRLHISHIIVDSQFRNHGIGTKMINYMEKIAIEKNIEIIELVTTKENKDTINFYNKLGFNIARVQFEKNLGENNDN